MQIYNCNDKCCKIKINEGRVFGRKNRRGQCYKAGVFIYDPTEKKVLLVMSNGNLWGLPKGSVEIEKKETYKECAIREVREETGLVLDPDKLLISTKLFNRAVYYYLEKSFVEVSIQNEDKEDNDANGISWIKTECLEKCIADGKIILNHHCKVVFKKFLGITFPNSGFIKVKRRKRKVN